MIKSLLVILKISLKEQKRSLRKSIPAAELSGPGRGGPEPVARPLRTLPGCSGRPALSQGLRFDFQRQVPLLTKRASFHSRWLCLGAQFVAVLYCCEGQGPNRSLGG